jgi:hypothetical protein
MEKADLKKLSAPIYLMSVESAVASFNMSRYTLINSKKMLLIFVRVKLKELLLVTLIMLLLPNMNDLLIKIQLIA